jgi:hypothetical protein
MINKKDSGNHLHSINTESRRFIINLKIIAYLTLLFRFAVFAEDINISGTVSNQAGRPISGAIVILKGQNLTDTTDSKGAYSLVKGTSSIKTFLQIPHTGEITLNNGNLHLTLAQAAQVKIEFYDMSGNLLKRELDQFVSTGEYSYNLRANEFATRMTAVRVAVGGQSTTFRLFQGANGRYAASLRNSGTSSFGEKTLAKIQTSVDNLDVSAPNCTTKVVPVSSFNQVINITMDTLPRFSFFVTSLKALRLLSGNPKGFGGDLRFGKTGQGAGLLGADSICSCIAETSMKGARFKQWRAFLSVAKGPAGTQVNAIERIGSGPWYDRLGRLLANSTSEFLNDRPSAADVAIKNDLPNEDGVPNHQPDPAKAVVDNHMTITGSDTKGKLYSATATCDDWTATTGQGGSKPRAGLSWPQGFSGGMGGGMKNWLSVMDCAGCQAGIDSTDASGAGTRNIYTIGNGGGYGGFYCFALNP